MKAVPTSNRSPPRRRASTKKSPARPGRRASRSRPPATSIVADWAAHEIFQFNAAGEYVSAWNGGTLPNGAASETPEGNFGPEYAPLEVAAEDSTGNVLVNNPSNASIDVFDKNGNFLSRTSHAELGGELDLLRPGGRHRPGHRRSVLGPVQLLRPGLQTDHRARRQRRRRLGCRHHDRDAPRPRRSGERRRRGSDHRMSLRIHRDIRRGHQPLTRRLQGGEERAMRSGHPARLHRSDRRQRQPSRD